MYADISIFNIGTIRMIYSELKNYIIQVSSSDTVDLFDNAITVFDKYNVPEYMSIFENTFGEFSDLSADAILDYLLADLRVILGHLLSIQGVALTSETSISQLIMVADALFELPYYEDKVILKDTLNNDSSDVDKFCDLLELITPSAAEDFMSIVETLDENFITNFNNQIKNVEEKEILLETINEHVTAYIKFKDIILKDASNYCDKFFNQVSSVGLPYEDYIKQYILDKNEYLHNTDNATYIESVAQDLVGLTTLSCDGLGNPLLVIRKYLSEIYPDIVTTTKIDTIVSKIVLLYTQ